MNILFLSNNQSEASHDLPKHDKQPKKQKNMRINIAKVIAHLESVAPPVYQESYDNAGLIVGSGAWECTGVLTCLDSTEAVIDEAIAQGCNLVVAHHPIVFKGLKRFNGKNYVERVVMKAIKHDIAIYAIHTNLDNVYAQGVNARIAAQLKLKNTRILAPKANMVKLVVVGSADYAQTIEKVVTQAASSAQTPTKVVRYINQTKEHLQLEAILPAERKARVSQELKALGGLEFWFEKTELKNPLTGSGLVGELEAPMDELDFLRFLKQQMQAGCVKYTALSGKKIEKVALCGGAGGFLLPNAIAAGAQIFITADYKYHEFFDAENRIIIADIGHFESEQYTIELLAQIIQEKFGTFAVRLSTTKTNPVNYL